MLAKGRGHTRGRYCTNGHDTKLPGAIRYTRKNDKIESVCVSCAKDRNNRYLAKLRTQNNSNQNKRG